MTENPPPQYYAPAPMLESEARTMSMLAHLLVLVGGFVPPLVIWLIYRDRSALVDAHGKEQLNFQISLIIYTISLYVLSTIAALVTFGIGFILLFPLFIGIGIFALVVVILASVAANNGQYYRIPLTIRFIS
jgi:uncharacterized Tic20 family protein